LVERLLDFLSNIIMRYRKRKRSCEGKPRVFLGRREYQEVIAELKKAIQLLGRTKNGNLILFEDSVFTMYKKPNAQPSVILASPLK